ncbi:c-type cytochrome [Rubritalea tangerina]|uniref:C-type cytochrome n=1 Tax=Rubritalea tangerina TaxID=430798 RepID=A0ABW4Z727_9BACT
MKKLALILASTVVGLGAAHAEADGAKIYATCAACHQANGQGLPGAFPPLAESEWVNGPAENLIRIQLRGLMGPITVKGKQYNSVMPPNAAMSDEDIAAVLTYVRSNFGNKASAVTADQVKALRSEVGKPMLKAEELIDPNKAEEKKEEAPAEGAEKPAAEGNAQAEPKQEAPAVALKAGETTASGTVKKSEHLSRSSETFAFGGFAAWTLLSLIPVVTGIGRK